MHGTMLSTSMLRVGLREMISRGIVSCWLSPCPRMLLPAAPHEYVEPSSVRTKVEDPAHATAEHFKARNAITCLGACCGEVSPWPTIRGQQLVKFLLRATQQFNSLIASPV